MVVLLDQRTKKLVQKFSPMWTNKQAQKFEDSNPELTFDAVCAKPNSFESWNSKMSYPDAFIRETAIRTLEDLTEGYELWIANKSQGKLDEKYVAYIATVMAGVAIQNEICLSMRIEDECFVVSVDEKADLFDCREFFAEFYHLAFGFNYDINIGIPDDETEAKMYCQRLQEEFDEEMKAKLGDVYEPGNTYSYVIDDTYDS